jgi:hypothetical protein
MDEDKDKIKSQNANPITFVDDGSGSPMCLEVKDGLKKNLGQFNDIKLTIGNFKVKTKTFIE